MILNGVQKAFAVVTNKKLNGNVLDGVAFTKRLYGTNIPVIRYEYILSCTI
jgi:hypothetical protein